MSCGGASDVVSDPLAPTDGSRDEPDSLVPVSASNKACEGTRLVAPSVDLGRARERQDVEDAVEPARSLNPAVGTTPGESTPPGLTAPGDKPGDMRGERCGETPGEPPPAPARMIWLAGREFAGEGGAGRDELRLEFDRGLGSEPSAELAANASADNGLRVSGGDDCPPRLALELLRGDVGVPVPDEAGGDAGDLRGRLRGDTGESGDADAGGRATATLASSGGGGLAFLRGGEAGVAALDDDDDNAGGGKDDAPTCCCSSARSIVAAMDVWMRG